MTIEEKLNIWSKNGVPDYWMDEVNSEYGEKITLNLEDERFVLGLVEACKQDGDVLKVLEEYVG